jgi:ribosome biogenesis protein ERB1
MGVFTLVLLLFLSARTAPPMAGSKPTSRAPTKRKRPVEEPAENDAALATTPADLGKGLPDLEDPDEDEDKEGVPEIVEGSGDEEGGSDADSEDDDEADFTPDASEDEEDSASSADDEDDFVHGAEEAYVPPFPVARTVISTITGEPKRVYPDIEPDYDSDSSTEDVRARPLRPLPRAVLMGAGPEPDRERAAALVRRHAAHRVQR